MKLPHLSGKWRGLYAALGLAFVCAFGGLWWLVGTEGGLRWALSQAQRVAGPGLQFEGAHGSIASGLDIDRLHYEDDSVKVVAEKIHLRAAAAQALLLRLNIPELRIARIEVLLKPSADDEPPKLPQNLRLPLAVNITQVRIDVLGVQRKDLREAFHDLRLAYAGDAREHRLRDLRARSEYGSLTANATLGAERPFKLLATLALTRADDKLPLDLSVNAGGSLAQLKLAASMRLHDKTAQLQAVLAPFSSQWLQSMNAQTTDVDLHAFDSTWPQTKIKLALSAQSDAAQTGELRASIDLRNALPGPADKQRIPLVHIDSIVHTDFKSLRFEHLNIDLGDAGQISGKGSARSTGTELALTARKLNLRALYSSLRATALSGPVQLTLDREEQSVQTTLQQRDFKIALDATRKGTHIKLRRVQANAGGGQLSGSGEIDLTDAMPFAADLSVARLDPAQFGDFPDGNINAKAQLKGQIDKQHNALRVLDAQWRIENSTLKRQPLSSDGTLRVQTERITQSDIHARWGGANIDASGAFGGRGDSLNWHVDLPQLERMNEKLGGSVLASGRLAGEWRQPQLEFSADARRVRLPGDITIASAHSEGVLSNAADAPLRMDLRLSDLAVRDLRAASISATLDGSLAQHRLAIAMHAQNVDADARFEGGWTQAKGWRGQLRQLQNRGLYPLQLNAPVPIEASQQRVLIGRTDVRFAEGGVLIHDARWENHRLASSGEFNKLRAAWLLLATGMQQQLQSSLLLDGSWSIAASPQLNGSVSIHRASGDLQVQSAPAIDLGLQKLDVEARFINDRLEAQLALDSAIAQAKVDMRLQPIATEQSVRLSLDSPLDMKMQLQVASLRALSILFATTGRVDGRLQADLQGIGTLSHPLFSGTLNGDALKVDVPPFGVYLNNGRLRAHLDHETLKVDEFFIQGGAGSFSADGDLPLRMEAGGAHLNWHADKLSLLARPDMRLSVSGKGQGDFDGKKLRLQGELRADRGYFEFGENRLPELGDDVKVVGQVKPVPVARHARTPFEVDMQLDLGKQMEVHGYGFKGMLTGKVHLSTAEKGELRAAGQIRAERASFTAYSQQLQVEQGLITFDGPIDNPALYIQAWRRNQAVAVGVQITGTVASPQVELVSEPPVPEGEKLSWLVLGRAPDNAQNGDLALLQAAAGTLFSRGDKVGINQKLAHELGLDELSLRGSGALTGNVVALGKRLSDKIYVTYEQGIGAAQNLVQLDYTLSRRWSARLETGTLSSIGVIYRIVFD